MITRRAFLAGAAAWTLLGARRARGDAAVGKLGAPASHDAAAGAGKPTERPHATLRRALEEAAARGRKLLVLVAFDEDDRDRLLGAWIGAGTDAEVAPLAQLELAAATMRDVRRVAPELPAAPTDPPLLVMLDPRRQNASVFDGALPWLGTRRSVSAAAGDARRVQAIARWVASLAPADGDERALARIARARWSRRRIPGSRWAHTSGCCGEEIENETREEVLEAHSYCGCGMGSVPDKSVRFLQFLTARKRAAD